MKKNISSKLDTDKVEGIKDQLKYVAMPFSDKTHIHTFECEINIGSYLLPLRMIKD